jgi:protein phosphatase
MTETEQLPSLIEKAREQMSQLLIPPQKVKREVFVGDTHGAFDVADSTFKKYVDNVDLIAFLGDYVDRGHLGVETLGLILSKFLEDLRRVVMLRGNHESPLTNLYYGFAKEAVEKFGENGYDMFKGLFQSLPYATVVNEYMCVQGGLPQVLERVNDIAGLSKDDLNPDDQTAFQLLWNDPRDMIAGFIPSVRGEGAYYFGKDVTTKFLSENRLKGIIRGHEVADGFREDMDRKVLTVFSSRYHGGSAGILVMNGEQMERVVV